MIEPLHISFEVRCSVAHAFEVWTSKISRWWPADHTVSGASPLAVVLEGRAGGRIYERTVDGVEFDWGEVTVWDPPRRLAYQWHLGRDRSAATEVQITFRERGETTTVVDIDHRGWERLGREGAAWRDANAGGWASLLPHFVRTATRPSAAE